MYIIVGADNREYGPITAEQLTQWIVEGRANAQTRVQVVETGEWKLIAECPDLVDAVENGPQPSVPHPVVSADEVAAGILARDYQIDIGHCFKRAWELVKENFWLLVAATLVAYLIASGGGIPYIGPLIGLIVGGPMMGGYWLFVLKRIRNEPLNFADVFLGFSIAFVPLMLAYLVSNLLTAFGFFLCILPGIYLGVSWVFTIPLVIDKNLDFWPAMELSRKVVTKHWWAVFGLVIVYGLVVVAGIIACCIGVIVTLPIAGAMLMYAYEDIFGSHTITS